MLRSLFVVVFFFSFSFAACENDRVPPEEQPPPPPQQEQQQEMPGDAGVVDISDDELEKFVKANMKAQEERLDPQRDRAELEEVVEETGLDMQEFVDIQMAVQQDPQLQQQVQQKMQDAQDDAYPER